MVAPADFSLYTYIHHHAPHSDAILAGSATTPLSFNELVSLSKDPSSTNQALTNTFPSLSFSLCSNRGSEQLRTNIAATYDSSLSKTTADSVVVANGTSGANHIVLRSLLSAGDHVIIQYPIYGPLIEEPRDIGCDISYLHLMPSDNWAPNIAELKSLIKPGKTKMIILNNPGNPTGSQIDTSTQRTIIEIAKEHNVHLHCDEIFRPFFYTSNPPTSLNEHADLNYDRITTTSSLSKCYGGSGVRVGWITTRCPELYEKFLNYRMYTIHSLSVLDEVVATEMLSDRCRQAILQKHLAIARRNLDLIQDLVSRFPDQIEWTTPVAGAVAFLQFKDPVTGKPVDDVKFCEELVQSKKVLLSPGTLCFEFAQNEKMKNEFRGRVRLHFTAPTELVEQGLKGVAEYLEEQRNRRKSVNAANHVNGVELPGRGK